MTTERDPGTRIVLSWLREDAHENAERVLLRALDVVDTTPQRRSWWPARRLLMPTYAKLVATAAALLVVAVVGYNLLPGTGVGGPAAPTPTPTPAPTAAALPSDDAAVLPAGTYVTGGPFTFRVTSTVPAGWHGHVAGPYYADLWKGATNGGLYLLRPSMVAKDACNISKGFTQIPGESVSDLVTALRATPGITVSNVSSTSIAGYSGTALVLTAPADISGCGSVPGYGYTFWMNPLGGASPNPSAGESLRAWILDVAGQRLVVVLEDADYSATDRAELQAIFDSLRIETAN